jgi:hypothetical protein
MMRNLKLFGAGLVLVGLLLCPLGCMNCNIAIRGTVDVTRQHATTEGRTTSSPKKGSASISAEKTTDVALPVSE